MAHFSFGLIAPETANNAYGTLAKSAGATGELSALREAVQRAAQAGKIVLVTKTHSPPDTAKPQCRAFEYIAVRLAGKNNLPAWKSDLGD